MSFFLYKNQEIFGKFDDEYCYFLREIFKFVSQNWEGKKKTSTPTFYFFVICVNFVISQDSMMSSGLWVMVFLGNVFGPFGGNDV